MHKHQRRACPHALVGDLEPLCPNGLHRLNLHAGQDPSDSESSSPGKRRDSSVEDGKAG
jgi:hypothetical protein